MMHLSPKNYNSQEPYYSSSSSLTTTRPGRSKNAKVCDISNLLNPSPTANLENRNNLYSLDPTPPFLYSHNTENSLYRQQLLPYNIDSSNYLNNQGPYHQHFLRRLPPPQPSFNISPSTTSPLLSSASPLLASPLSTHTQNHVYNHTTIRGSPNHGFAKLHRSSAPTSFTSSTSESTSIASVSPDMKPTSLYTSDEAVVSFRQAHPYISKKTHPMTYELLNDVRIDKSKKKKGGYRCSGPNCKENCTFQKILELAKHLDEIGIKNEFKCDVVDCSYRIIGFSTSGSLKRHSKIHEKNSDVFKCDYCDRGFRNVYNKHRHEKQIHPN